MTALAVVTAALGACGEDAIEFSYPLDDVLRMDHLQAPGSHNSYHVAPETGGNASWMYTHRPLAEQTASGMRQFELDVNMDWFENRFHVYHVYRVDQQTTCDLLVDCLRELKNWSDDNPAHHPLFIMLEIRDPFDPNDAQEVIDGLEQEVLSVWPENRLVTPDLVQGQYPTLREAVAEGWPTLGAVRGRALFFLLGAAEYMSFYTDGDTTSAGRPFFVTGAIGADQVGIVNIDDPSVDPSSVDQAVAAGLLVRSRVDVVDDQLGPVLDPAKLQLATDKGVHFINSDSMGFQLSEGTPSRCNPVTAPAECTSAALEDPAFIR